MITDMQEFLFFILENRAPSRLMNFSIQLIEEMRTNGKSSDSDKMKLMGIIYEFLNTWGWRGKKLVEAYLSSGCLKISQSSTKVRNNKFYLNSFVY